jgi:predicted nucleotidyltransferase
MTDLAPAQMQAIAGWAEKTHGIAQVRLFGSRAKDFSRPDDRVNLALTIGGVGIGDPFTHYFSEHEKWNAELIKLLGVPTRVHWHDRKGAPRVYALCQEAGLLIYSR